MDRWTPRRQVPRIERSLLLPVRTETIPVETTGMHYEPQRLTDVRAVAVKRLDAEQKRDQEG